MPATCVKMHANMWEVESETQRGNGRDSVVAEWLVRKPSPANQPRSLKPEACVQVVVAMLEPLLEGGPVTQAAAAVVTAIVQVSRGLSAAA